MVTFDLLDAFSIPFILLLGIVTSYSDMKHKKIRNKWIIASFCYSVFILVASSIYIYIKEGLPNLGYYSVFAVNLLSALFFGVILWLSGMWSAGDAKLFLAYSALIPLSTYKWGSIGTFPSFIILINIFTPAFVFFSFKVLSKTKPAFLLAEIKRSFDPKVLLSLVAYTLGFFWMINSILFLIGISPDFFSGFIILAVLFFLFEKLKRDILTPIGMIIILFRLVADANGFSYLEAVSLIILILIRLLISLGYYAFSKQIYIESLKPGMAMAEDILDYNGKYIREKKLNLSFIPSFISKKEGKSIFENINSLTEKDVKIINVLHSAGKIPEHNVYIKEEIPFAIIMFLGVVLTIVARGNILISLLKIFNL